MKHKEPNKAMVPALRFPEFREAGEWEPKRLDDVIKSESSLLAQNKLQLVSKGYPVYGADGLIGFTASFSQKENYIAIIKDGSGVGRLSLYKKESSILGTLTYLMTKNSKSYDLTWLYYLLGTIDFSVYVKGSGIPHIYYSDYAKQLVAVPSFAEQQKIATLLTTLDALHTAESEKLKALQAHKKGLMQQLFPAAGEVVPRVRFGEFEGEWESKKLGDLIDIKGRIGYRGYTVEDIVKEGEGAIALSPSNINGAGSLSFEKSTYISWFKYEESPEIMLEVGQTILVKTGSTYGKSAFISVLPKKCTINPQLVVLKPIRVNSAFLFLLVSHNSIQKQINETVVGGAIPTLSQDSISKFDVLVPKKKEEQQKIAACLTTLDDLLAAQSEKLSALKKQKQGLMQQLFPNPNDPKQ